MSNDDRLNRYFENDFPGSQGVPRSEDRIANAVEYSAYQLGKIRRLLEEINEREKLRS